jgi:CRP-like cAMP-binding protein
MFVVQEETFNDLLYNHPDIASKLLMNLFYVIGERLREFIKGKLIDENVPTPKLLRGFKEPEKRRLLKFSKIVTLPKGQPLFVEGQASDEMYYVLSGAIEIVKKTKGRQQRLAIMGEGDIFGELGLITGKGRMASAVALSDSDLLAMSEGGLLKLRKRNPEIATKLFHNLFRITTARLRSLIVPVIGA